MEKLKKEFLGKYFDNVGLFFMYSYHTRRLKHKKKNEGLTEKEEYDFFGYANEAQKALMRSELHEIANKQGEVVSI